MSSVPDGQAGGRSRPPPHAAVAAFGAVGAGMPLGGGQLPTWHFGEIVLKALDTAAEAIAWQAEVLGALDDRPDFRVAPPLPAQDGEWVVAGWTAWRYEPGRQVPGRWRETIEVGEALHAAVCSVPKPAFFDRREDRWALADRVAWGELSPGGARRGRDE